MGIKCISGITKVYKKAKADCLWPTYYPDNEEVPNPDYDGLPKCGGNITVSVAAVDKPDYHSDHYAALDVEITCDRCKAGSFEGHLALRRDPGAMLAKYVEQAVQLAQLGR